MKHKISRQVDSSALGTSLRRQSIYNQSALARTIGSYVQCSQRTQRDSSWRRTTATAVGLGVCSNIFTHNISVALEECSDLPNIHLNKRSGQNRGVKTRTAKETASWRRKPAHEARETHPVLPPYFSLWHDPHETRDNSAPNLHNVSTTSCIYFLFYFLNHHFYFPA